MSSLIMYTLREKYPETSHFKCLRVYLIIFVLIFISQGLFAQERQDPGHVHSDTRSMHKMKEYILEKERQLMEEMERQMEEIRNRYREEFMQRYDVPREEPLPDVPEATTTPEQIKPDDFELEERLRKMEQQMMEEMEEQYRYESIMPAQQTSFQTGPVDEQDSLALVALYNTMDGDNWDNNTNWLSEEPVSDWYGVVVQDDRVVRIELVWNSLSGVLPDEINNLDSLTYLNLGGERFVWGISRNFN